jgi:hypothetical protein
LLSLSNHFLEKMKYAFMRVYIKAAGKNKKGQLLYLFRCPRAREMQIRLLLPAFPRPLPAVHQIINPNADSL